MLLPIGVVVHGHHRVSLDDAVLLGKVLLCECLYYCVRKDFLNLIGTRVDTYHVIVAIAELLAHELVHPLGGLVVAAAGLHSWNYERHV